MVIDTDEYIREKDEQEKLLGMLKANPSLYKFIRKHGNFQARLVLSNIYVLQVASWVYINLRNIKRYIKT